VYCTKIIALYARNLRPLASFLCALPHNVHLQPPSYQNIDEHNVHGGNIYDPLLLSSVIQTLLFIDFFQDQRAEARPGHWPEPGWSRTVLGNCAEKP
jgi:hypothetical protein